MPVRFASPSLGGHQAGLLLEKGHWEVSADFRRLTADKWYIGTKLREDASPFGKQLFLNIMSVNLTATYGVSNRLSASLTAPFAYATQSRFHSDLQRHVVKGRGLGDMSLLANYWLRNPSAAASGNLMLTLGLKASTGNNKIKDTFYSPSGSAPGYVDQSVQQGDGGWGIVVGGFALRRVAERLDAYAGGTYMLSTKTKSDVPFNQNALLSVPDVYAWRAGLAYSPWPTRGLSVSLGVRADGIPVRDIIGGADNGFRRPGVSVFVDPGLSWNRGPHTLSFSFPVRAYFNFKNDPSGQLNGGDLADYLIFAGYKHHW